jgi:hypothetical protein
MYARFLAVTTVVVSSLWVSTVFGQCCGTVSYMPVVPACTAYYAPPAPCTTCYAPYTTCYAAPCTTCYAAPCATYYTPTVVAYPAYYARPGRSVFGAPRVYVAGQPVRNVLRAVTP